MPRDHLSPIPRHLLVFVPFYPPYIGGIVNHSEEFTNAFAKAGTNVTVVIPQLPGMTMMPNTAMIQHIYYPAKEAVPHFPIPCIWSFRFWRAIASLRHQSYDCVISRTRFFLSSLIALIYAKLMRLPIIHIEHGSDHMQRMGSPLIKWVARVYDATIGRLLLVSSDRVVAIAPGVYEFVSRYGRTDSILIYRGLDIRHYDSIVPDPRPREQYPSKLILFWSGRMSHWKGLPLLIQALRILPLEDRNHLVCLLVGEGEDRDALERASEGLPVVFTGSLPRDRVIALLKSSDIYVHTSHPGGGLSTSLLEAMVCAKAVVATPHEGAIEVVNNGTTGILLGEHSAPKELAEQLTLLLHNKALRETLGANARELVARRFCWERAVQQYSELISTIKTKNICAE